MPNLKNKIDWVVSIAVVTAIAGTAGCISWQFGWDPKLLHLFVYNPLSWILLGIGLTGWEIYQRKTPGAVRVFLIASALGASFIILNHFSGSLFEFDALGCLIVPSAMLSVIIALISTKWRFLLWISFVCSIGVLGIWLGTGRLVEAGISGILIAVGSLIGVLTQIAVSRCPAIEFHQRQT